MDRTFLILGGAGMVGSRVVGRIVRDLAPEKIVIVGLTAEEVAAAVDRHREEAPESVEIVGEAGDIFLAGSLAHRRRREVLDDPAARREMFDDMLGPFETAYARSHLATVIARHRPEVIVDAVNTATAISYQDVATAAHVAERGVDRLLAGDPVDPSAIAGEVQSLILSIAVPQLVRHVLILDRAMRDAGTRLYLKVGTTGTGGMGLNVPYTHSEDRPSAKLLGKTAVGFAHTGLLFLMARTPGSPIVKEVKPGALIGYREVDHRTIREKGATVWLYQTRTETLGTAFSPQQDGFERRVDLQLPVVDTGENGVFTKGEFEAITALGQMELVTPEEVAAVCIREILGANTGRDVIAAIDGAIVDPSYRGGVLRSRVLTQLEGLEAATGTHSVALGQLGPPELSKLLWEAELITLIRQTVPHALRATPEQLSAEATALLADRRNLADTIGSLGIPILAADGITLRRGPFVRIPEVVPGETEVPMTPQDRDRWAAKGWVDLRPANFAVWQERLRRIAAEGAEKGLTGSARVAAGIQETEDIRAGAVVAWVLANELGGHR